MTNELQTMGLTSEVEYIPVDASMVPYTFSVKLDDRTYFMTIKYNDPGGFFTMDLAIMATGEVLCYGDPVRYGRPMFSSVEDARYPIPVIVPYCLTGEVNEITYGNFGNEVKLYLHERRTD